MSKVEKNVTKGSTEESAPTSAAPVAAEAARPAGQQTVHIDDTNLSASYANFCRVSSTPEEVILDLGLNPNSYTQVAHTTVHISQRVVMNHFTAKRLLAALSMALQRHEQAFGNLETDVRKRVRQS